ncbi:Ferrous iron transport protein B [compost metagenome]
MKSPINTHHTAKSLPTHGRRIVLVGNPNVGKSVFFNALTGLYVDVSNYPGTTIEISRAPYGDDTLMDTPGVYGVSSFNDEERIARDIILEADVVVNVVSSLSLERDLFLTQQLLDMGKRVVVALNQSDEARANGLTIDAARLSALMGVPVIPTVAIKNEGIADVRAAITRAFEAPFPQLDPDLQRLVDRLEAGTPAERLMVLEGDETVAERAGLPVGTEREALYALRRTRVNALVAEVVKESDQGATFATRLGRWMLHPLVGLLSAAGVLAALYYLIGDLIAQQLVAITEETIMLGIYEPAVRGLVERVFAEGTHLHTILVGEFGLLTMTVTYILGLLLPLAVGFYFFLAVLEDSGYLPRLAVLVDRGLSKMGLNGRAVIPLIIGFGCVTMATITTRLLGTQRERTIATAILGLTIPCSAQVGVILGMLATVGGWQAWAIYGGTMFTVLVAVGTILDKVVPGKSSALLIDLPPMRFPNWKNVFKKTSVKSWQFLTEASPLFMLGALIVTLLQISGGLDLIQRALAPATVGLLKLPPQTATAFIMGLIRRDFGAAGLTDLPLSPDQVIVSLVVITLFVPCIATVTVLFKERGWREALTLWLGSWVIAFAVGGTLAAILM